MPVKSVGDFSTELCHADSLSDFRSVTPFRRFDTLLDTLCLKEEVVGIRKCYFALQVSEKFLRNVDAIISNY